MKKISAISEIKTDNILLVDDEPANIKLLFAYLKKHGFNTCLAESGQEALEMLRSFKPDLVLLDINMPRMDGFQTCQSLKAQEEMSEVPVIFLTANTEIVDKKKGFELGAVDYITKPMELKEVLMRINAHLKTYKQIRRLANQLESFKEEPVCRPDEYGLNARETDILKLFSHGYKRVDIARKFGITENTLKWYLKTIYSKLGVNNRADACAKAREMGL